MNEVATRQALERLEAMLQRREHPLAYQLKSGLDAAEVRSRTQAVGIRLPDDALELWRWHDGVDPAFTLRRGRVPGSEFLPGGGLLLPLADAIKWYVEQRDNFPRGDLDDWSIDWFPAVRYGHGDINWLDCSGPAEGPTPMVLRYNFDYNEPEQLHQRRIPSVAEAVDVWTILLEREIWAVDPRTGAYDFTRDPDPDLPTAWIGVP